MSGLSLSASRQVLAQLVPFYTLVSRNVVPGTPATAPTNFRLTQMEVLFMNVLRLFPQSIVYANQVTPGKPGSLARLEQAELGRIIGETLTVHSLIPKGWS